MAAMAITAAISTDKDGAPLRLRAGSLGFPPARE